MDIECKQCIAVSVMLCFCAEILCCMWPTCKAQAYGTGCSGGSAASQLRCKRTHTSCITVKHHMKGYGLSNCLVVL